MRRRRAVPVAGDWPLTREEVVVVAPARRLLSTAAARSAGVHDWSRGVHAAEDSGLLAPGGPPRPVEVAGRGAGCREVAEP